MMRVNEAGAGEKYHSTCERLLASPSKDRLIITRQRGACLELLPRRGSGLTAQDGRGGNISEKWQGGHLSQDMDQRVMKILEESIYSTGNP